MHQELKKFRPKFDLDSAFHPNSLIKCSRAIVKSAIEIDHLERDERIVFEAVINWAKNWCRCIKIDPNNGINLRRALTGILAVIPFHKMSHTQFDECVKKYPGLLQNFEIHDILVNIQNKPV